MTGRVFDFSESDVVAGVACTWCGHDVAEECRDWRYNGWESPSHAHAQRWYDFWNATRAKGEAFKVHRAPWFGRAYSGADS